MPVPHNLSEMDEKQIVELLQSIIHRIERIEQYLGIESGAAAAPDEFRASAPEAAPGDSEARGGMELRFGEYGLAWIGSVILLCGLAFMTAYAFSSGFVWLSVAAGYVASAILYLISRFWRRSFALLSVLMLAGSFVMLYYTTIRLHFFSDPPLIRSPAAAAALLLMVVAFQFLVANRIRSELLAGIAFLSALLTGFFIDQPLAGFILIVAGSTLGLWFWYRYNWWRLFLAAIPLAYAAHLLWLLNNPLMGHPLQAAEQYSFQAEFLFLTSLIFSLPWMFRERAGASDVLTAASTLLNGGGFLILLLLITLTFLKPYFARVYLLAAVFFLLVSVLQWRRTHLQIAPSLTACVGFLALTASIFGYVKIPHAYFWLSLQSLLVVCMALWYRSKIIVVVNTFIYLILFMAYFFGSPPVDDVNASFALVALASARIMNWKKERLTLQTEMFRNAYLVAAFIAVLYFLYHAVPAHYVTLSWTGAAALYFLLSLLLRNIKYRLMAMFTMVVTVLYLLLIDLPRLEAKFRVLAFLFLGLISLGISLYYTRFRIKSLSSQKERRNHEARSLDSRSRVSGSDFGSSSGSR